MFEITEKIKRLRGVLEVEGLDILIITDLANLQWFTTVKEDFGTLVVTRSKLFFFVSPLSIGNYEKLFQNQENIELVEFDKGFDQRLTAIISEFKAKVVGFEENLKYRVYEKMKKLVEPAIFKKVKDISYRLRALKFDYEINYLKKAEEITKKSLEWVRGEVREGQTEKEIAWMLEKYAREMGADSLSFDPIVAVNENSAIPHYQMGNKALSSGDIILVDFGVKINGYCADMTDTFVFGHTSNAEYGKVIQIVRDALMVAKSWVPKDSDVRIIDSKVRQVINEKGYEPYMHSLGHALGLEIHERPSLHKDAKENYILEKGMVITLEPGIYLPGKFGVRIEEMYFV